MAVETPEYEVLTHENPFEVRRYPSYLTASVRVSANDYGRAMNAGFEPLADFIFGNNHAADRISMTAPVTAGRACCQRISMTAPVTAQQSEDEYVVSFTMPSGYSLQTLPRPNNAAVSIESVDAHLAAVVRFGGSFSGSRADPLGSPPRKQLETGPGRAQGRYPREHSGCGCQYAAQPHRLPGFQGRFCPPTSNYPGAWLDAVLR